MFESLKAKLFDIFLDKFEWVIFVGLMLFFGIGGLFIQAKLSFFIMGVVFGAYLSFAALPIFESDRLASKPLMCAALGAVLSAVLGLFLGWSIDKVFIGSIGGLIFGYFAPVWARYM